MNNNDTNLIGVPPDLFIDLVEIACEHETDIRWMKQSGHESRRREWQRAHDVMQRAVELRNKITGNGAEE